MNALSKMFLRIFTPVQHHHSTGCLAYCMLSSTGSFALVDTKQVYLVLQHNEVNKHSAVTKA